MLMKKILHQATQQMAIKQSSTSSHHSASYRDSNLLHLAIKNNLVRTIEYVLKREIASPNQLALIQSIR